MHLSWTSLKLPTQPKQVVQFVVAGSWVYHVPYLYFSYRLFAAFLWLCIFFYNILETNQGIPWWSWCQSILFWIRTVSLGTEGARGKWVIHSALWGALYLQDTGKISLGIKTSTSTFSWSLLKEETIQAKLFYSKDYWKDWNYHAGGRGVNIRSIFSTLLLIRLVTLVTFSFPVCKVEGVMIV